jgi:hypothetical protein
MKFGIIQLAQLTVQALEHQAKSLSRQISSRSDIHSCAEALFQQIHAEAEKSRAALRLLMREVLDASHQAARRDASAQNTRENEEKAHAINQAQAAIDRIVGKYQPQKIAA